MVSGKERLRLERQWNEMKERMDRQAEALTRMAALHTHLMAGLLEIANMPAPVGMEDDLRGERAVALAEATLRAADELRLAGSGNEEKPED